MTNPTVPQPRSLLFRTTPYHTTPFEKSQETAHRLFANESALGPSPAAVAAYHTCAATLHHYPDRSSKNLRQAIGEKHHLNPEHIVCGAGSDELLLLLASAYLEVGDEAIYTQHGFLMYRSAILGAGGTAIIAEEKNCKVDIPSLLSKVTPRTKLIFLANPNNPTGTYLTQEEIHHLHTHLPPNVLLVLDSAYAEFVEERDYQAGDFLVQKHENVVMLRTFSKIYGLATLRVGWCFAPSAICDILNRIRNPFNISAPASAAAEASLGDSTHLSAMLAHMRKWRPWIAEECEKLGIKVTPSVCNFILLHFPKETIKTPQAAEAFLAQRNILVRNVAAYDLKHSLRITIGPEESNHQLVEGLKAFMT